MTLGRTIFVLCLSTLFCVGAARAATRPPVSYGRDIRPILSDKCYRCHGPDAETRKADLRLDTQKGLTGEVIAPGKPENSELVRRVFSNDDDDRMPPPR